MTLIEEYAIRHERTPCQQCDDKPECTQPMECPALLAYMDMGALTRGKREYIKHLRWSATTW